MFRSYSITTAFFSSGSNIIYSTFSSGGPESHGND